MAGKYIKKEQLREAVYDSRQQANQYLHDMQQLLAVIKKTNQYDLAGRFAELSQKWAKASSKYTDGIKSLNGIK